MKLLVIRHGRAESAKAFARTGASDDERPLTDDGRERLRRGAAGLHRLVDSVDILASSPLARARETADIVAAELEPPGVVEVDALRPGSPPEALVEWLQDAGSDETIAVVGHETQLQELVGWLLTGKAEQIVRIKKGAAVMLKLRPRGRRSWGPGSGTLLWALAPRQLRMLAG